MTRWQLHVESWKGCTRCDLHATRRKVVLGRGVVPCDIVFIGEAPGKTENSLGEPFTGRSGHVLDGIIGEALAGTPSVKYALTNLIGCIPLGEDGNKTAEPEPDSIKACAPRLVEFVDLAAPKVIVCVGRHADNYTAPWLKQGAKLLDAQGKSIPRVSITHPAAILRAKTSYQGGMRNKCVIVIRDAVKKYITNPQPKEEFAVGQYNADNLPF